MLGPAEAVAVLIVVVTSKTEEGTRRDGPRTLARQSRDLKAYISHALGRWKAEILVCTCTHHVWRTLTTLGTLGACSYLNALGNSF